MTINRERSTYALAGLSLIPTALAEISILNERVVAGAVLHALLVQIYFAGYLKLTRDSGSPPAGTAVSTFAAAAPLLPALAVVSIIRLLSLSLSTSSISEIYWYIAVGTLSIITALLAARGLGLGLEGIGMRPLGSTVGRELLVGLLGLPLAVLGFLALRDAGPVREVEDINPIVLGVIIVLFVSLMEELVFRGLIQGAANHAMPGYAWLWSSALYGIMLLGTDSFEFVAVFSLMGAIFGLLVQRTGSIAGVTIAHSIMRLGLLLVLPGIFPS